MANFTSLSLARFKELIEADSSLAANYISKRLAIIVDISPQFIFKQFASTPILVPEMRLLIITRGWARVEVNMVEHRFNAGNIVYLAKNGLVRFIEASPDIRGAGMAIDDELFNLAISSNMPEAFNGHVRDFVISVTPDEQQYFISLHRDLYNKISNAHAGAMVSMSLVAAILWLIDALYSRHKPSEVVAQSRQQRLFNDFIALVGEHATSYHSLDFYAQRLCVTPRYMSTIVKEISGKTAKQWLDDTIIARAKVELKHSDKPVANISDDLNFPNPSFFNKYFKRLTGYTPSQFRDT